MRSLIGAAVILSCVVVPTVALADTNLLCVGSGYQHQEARYVIKKSQGVSVAQMSPLPFSGELRLHLRDNGADAVLPDELVPNGVPYSRKTRLTWDVTSLAVTNLDVRGEINFGDHQTLKMHVSRLTGGISLSGASSFNGICKKYDPQSAHNLF